MVLWCTLMGVGRAAPGEVTLGGAVWLNNLEQAKAESRDSGKPLLVFDLVGRLDEKWC